MSVHSAWRGLVHSPPWFQNTRIETTSPMAPSCTRLMVSRYAAWWRRCVPATIARPFCLAISAVSKHILMAAGSTPTGFSVKMFLPASTAARRCIARKAGGVARIT